MNIRPIRTKRDYQAALKLVSPYFDNVPESGSEEDDFFDVMVTLIEAYEQAHYPISPPTPIEAIKFRMEQGGVSVKDFAELIGSTSSRVYEILSGKRNLTLPMIRAINRNLGIPAESLIAEPTVMPLRVAKAHAATKTKVVRQKAAK